MKRFLVNLDNTANFDLMDETKVIVQFEHGMGSEPTVTHTEFKWSKNNPGNITYCYIVSAEADSTNIYVILCQWPDTSSQIYVEAEILTTEDITIINPESE